MTEIIPGCSVRISGCPKRYAHLEGQVGKVLKSSPNGWVSVHVNGEDVSMRASNLELVVEDETVDEEEADNEIEEVSITNENEEISDADDEKEITTAGQDAAEEEALNNDADAGENYGEASDDDEEEEEEDEVANDDDEEEEVKEDSEGENVVDDEEEAEEEEVKEDSEGENVEDDDEEEQVQPSPKKSGGSSKREGPSSRRTSKVNSRRASSATAGGKNEQDSVSDDDEEVEGEEEEVEVSPKKSIGSSAKGGKHVESTVTGSGSRRTSKIASITKDKEEGSDEDDGDDDEDIKALVDRALDKFAVSKFQPKSKVFAALHSRLLGTGRIIASKLKDSDGIIRDQLWKKEGRNVVEEAQRSAAIYDPQAAVAPSLKAPKPVKDESLGKGWFNMTPMKIDENLKRDIKMIQMRNYLDPKRFYKNPDKISKVLHVGTVIEGASEYNSSRMTRKERKQSLVEEILADSKIKDYTKRKYEEIQKDRSNKKRVYKKTKADKGGGNKKKLRAYF